VTRSRNYWSWRKYFVATIQNLKVLVRQGLLPTPIMATQLKLISFM
jgi:hypothetical protein